jgi:tricarballylate dehydrogenase
MSYADADVVVVGSGNAGLCAALAAREAAGARVLLLERAPAEWLGGNSYFSAGAIRTPHGGLGELVGLLDDPDDPLLAVTDVEPYSSEAFRADMQRLTHGRCDPQLTQTLVDEVPAAVRWMRKAGVRFRLMYERQAYELDGRWRFWGGLALGTVDGGKGLVAQLLSAVRDAGVALRFGSSVDRLLLDGEGCIAGVACGDDVYEAGAVVLASGGFEANPLLRARFLGPNWDLAKVRGTPYNTGVALRAALAIGAQPAGHWSGCHAVAWDASAPPHGSRDLTNRYTKQSYPLGIVVNIEGERFIDEGADLRNYTYAKYGAEILRQPGALAFQLFDAKTAPLLHRLEYDAPGVSRIEGETIEEIATAAGLPRERLRLTVNAYNRSVVAGCFDPTVKDGLGTHGLTPPKSNWAQPLDEPPYLAFAVTCGITFTFGGVRIDRYGRVLDDDGAPIPGLYAAGETVGGLFFHNYPGGAGLAAGAVFGRRAGRQAAVAQLRGAAP